MPNTAAAALPSPADAARGWWLGTAGVLIFALSIPMTRLAGGSTADPQLPAVFVALGRAALAGLLAIGYLAWVRAPRPHAAQWKPLALTAAGVVFGLATAAGLGGAAGGCGACLGGVGPVAAGHRRAGGLDAAPAPGRRLLGLRAGRHRAGGGLCVVEGGAALQAADALLAGACWPHPSAMCRARVCRGRCRPSRSSPGCW